MRVWARKEVFEHVSSSTGIPFAKVESSFKRAWIEVSKRSASMRGESDPDAYLFRDPEFEGMLCVLPEADGVEALVERWQSFVAECSVE